MRRHGREIGAPVERHEGEIGEVLVAGYDLEPCVRVLAPAGHLLDRPLERGPIAWPHAHFDQREERALEGGELAAEVAVIPAPRK